MNCTCGLEGSYETCCAPYHRGEGRAPTAERLMRSRYSAFVHGEIDYLIDTHAPETRGELDRDELERWARESDWKGLEIHEVKGGGEQDSEGEVEFTANYVRGGATHAHRECSHFRKGDEGWLFVDGHLRRTPVVAGPKTGRNDPCPCGSGKKFKKCCAA